MTASTASVQAAHGRRVGANVPFALTTPGWLRLAATVLVVALLVLGAIGVGAASERLRAARAAGLEAAALVEGAQEVYVSLADADAAATAAFLEAGLEPPELRARYEAAIDNADRALMALTTASSPQMRDAIGIISAGLPDYTQLVATARANNRLGFPVGAAYLNDASALMRDEILPAATAVYEGAAEGLHSDYEAATSARAVGVLAVVFVVVLVLLAATQVFLAVHTKRTFNIGLVSATLLVVVAAGVVAVTFTREQDALARAQREGSDGLIVLSTARILALRALSDENLDLIERGTVDTYMEDFAEVTHALGGQSGRGRLLHQAGEIAALTGSRAGVESLIERFERFMNFHDRVRLRVDEQDYEGAIALVARQRDAGAALDDGLEAEIAAASARLDEHTDDARDALRGVAAAIGLIVVVAVVLVLIGLQPRIREYR